MFCFCSFPVAPSPPFLLVDNCAQTTHSCDIVIQPNKVNTTLTCEVTGVYPELSLEFINDFPSEIKLWSQTQFISLRNNRYHVRVSAVVQPLQNFICSTEKYIVCNAFGPGASSLTNPEKEIQISYGKEQKVIYAELMSRMTVTQNGIVTTLITN